MSIDLPNVTVAARPQVGSPPAWAMPPISSDRIGPGLAVHSINLPDRDLVAVTVRLDAPVTTEALALSGVGTITARSLDEGTASHDGDSFAAALDRIGADWGPSVGFAGTMLSLSAPTDNLEAGLALLAEAIFTATFPQRDVARLVGQRRDRLARMRATTSGRADLVLREVAVAPGHRAGLPSGGNDDTMAALTHDDVVAHHRDVLVTGPADVVISGDLTGHDVSALVGRYFADLADPGRQRAPADPLRLQDGPRLVLVDHPGAVQTDLRVVRPGPDVHAEDRAATRLLTHVLGGPLTSRLDAKLREDKGFTYGVRSSLRSFRRGGMFVIASGSFETPTTAQSLDMIRSLAGTLAEQGPTAEEVAGAADYLTGVVPLSLETPRALAGVVAGNLGDDLATDHTTTYLQRLRAATHDDVVRAARTHLSVDDMVVVAVGDVAAIRDDVEALGWGDVVIHQD